ncbi:MAG TPA: L-seryl-tRNA(Sec) selenium transferase, partial [Candidatus Acidoferrales bacterium]|nr:L-seryl-tRNA(Sec) selenium transferase [Candidatus Acidoferrales bacterium]
MKTDARRGLPSVDAVVRAAGTLDVPRERFVGAVREVLAGSRADGAKYDDAAAVARAARALLGARDERSMRRVLNATGVVLQTNLGRAPLARAALEAIVDAAGAVSVEYDLAAGKRGERHGHATALLRELSGAEDGVVVNNNAAAVLLALGALAARREVIVSRGELVEIGGGFRIPDVLRRSGAKLVEVGTTNRTYVKDYAAAVSERTGAILRVHASNFKVTGFVARPDDTQL